MIIRCKLRLKLCCVTLRAMHGPCVCQSERHNVTLPEEQARRKGKMKMLKRQKEIKDLAVLWSVLGN